MAEYSDRRIARPAGAEPGQASVCVPRLPLMMADGDRAERVSSAVFGERVETFGRRGDFILVRHLTDHYVGWARSDGLAGLPEAEPDHWISAPMTYAFAEPDLKSAPKTTLFLGSRVKVSSRAGRYCEIDHIGWVPEQHVRRTGDWLGDPASVAMHFLGTPYLWGGRDAIGLDCSGLVQVAFAACGARLPRDTDMMFAWAGTALDGPVGPGSLQRNDLVFWRGHVGILLDPETLLHANASHMAVAFEPLADAIARIALLYGPPTGARRVPFPEGVAPAWLAAT